jgi:hypothetical protein
MGDWSDGQPVIQLVAPTLITRTEDIERGKTPPPQSPDICAKEDLAPSANGPLPQPRHIIT